MPPPSGPRKFHCKICDCKFDVMRALQAVRCQACGSMRTQELSVRIHAQTTRPKILEGTADRQRTEALARDPVTAYACVDCARKFEWNHAEKPNLSPTCAYSDCKSAEVVAISPTARVVMVHRGMQSAVNLAGKRPLTVKEAKRLKFVQKQWKMRCRFKEWLVGFENHAQRLGFTTERIEACKQMHISMLAEVDQKQQALLEQYYSSIPALASN